MAEPHANLPDSKTQVLPPPQDGKQVLPKCCPLESPGKLLKLLPPASRPISIKPGRVFLRMPRWFQRATTFGKHWLKIPSRSCQACWWFVALSCQLPPQLPLIEGVTYLAWAQVPPRACGHLMPGGRKVWRPILVTQLQSPQFPSPIGEAGAFWLQCSVPSSAKPAPFPSLPLKCGPWGMIP